MRKVLDLGELHKQLRQTEEHEPHFDEEGSWMMRKPFGNVC